VTTGAKIAIGCGIAVLMAGGVTIVAVVGLGFWAKGKVDQLAGNERQIDELHRKADGNVFIAPADGLLSEERLLKFLDARKRMYAIYEPHKAQLEALSNGKRDKISEIGDVTRGLAIVNDLRLAHAQALADVGMSRDEYRYFVEQVYKTMWAAEMEKNAAAAEDQAPPELPPAERETVEQQEKARENIVEMARDVEVPAANIALFRKYEADIKAYAMGGLEWIGL
jgi:hypothetical protein